MIGRYGTLGDVHFVEEPFWPLNTTLYVKDFKGNDARFCSFFLRTIAEISSSGTSAVPGVNRNVLHEVRVRRPPLDQQRRIASILGAYDDLIEVNRRRIAVLEAMARGLFEEWFGRRRFPPDTQGATTADIAWVEFGALATEVREAVSPTEVPSNTPYVGLEHLPRRSTTLDAVGRADEVASLKLRFQRGDVLFGKIRPYFHKVAWAPYQGVASSDAIVFRPKDSRTGALVAAVASSDDFVAQAVQTSNGTKMPRANPAILRAYRIPVRSNSVLDAFQAATQPMLELAAALQAANHQLAAARDLLLPRLISGELSVSAAEGELEPAA